MIRTLIAGLAGTLLLAASLHAQQLFKFTTGAQLDTYLPASSTPPFLGRGGYTATNGPAPDASDSVVVAGYDDFSFFPAGLLVPGESTNVVGYPVYGLAIPASAAGQPYAFNVELWLPAGHQVTSVSASLNWAADLDANQIVDPATEAPFAVEEQPPGFGPNLIIVDEWQPLISVGTVPTNDWGSQPVRQMWFTLSFGGSNVPPVYLRNFSLTIIPPAGTNAPVFVSAQQAGGAMTVELTNGPAAQFYNLLSSADAAAPIGSWSASQSGLRYNGVGRDMLTNPISGSQKFFRAQNLGSVYGDQILFEYEHLPVGGQWDGFAGQTNQGVYCGGAGGVFGVKRAPTAPDWWHGGFLFPQGQATTTSRIVVTTDGGGPFGAPVPFRLIAVDAEVYANTTNIWRGIDLRNGGSNLVWTLEPAVVPAGGYPDIGQPRYTQATTGSFTNTITEIQIFNSDAGWNNRYDNFVITTNVPATP